uniref:Uncharacterized protein n=1 Tax=Panagrolaimus sp. JU765 TaxID=591449 RepID=A0AC34Q305_9BILA
MMKKTNRPVLKSSGSETALDVLLIAPERISSCQMFWEDYDSEFVQLKIDKTKTSDQNTENLNKPGISQNLASDSKTSPNVSRPVSVTETVSELVLEESPQVEDSKIESETKEIQKNDEAETAQIIWNEFGNVWEKIEAKFEQLPSVSGHDQQNANQGVLECPNDVNKEEGGSTNDHAQLSEKEEATTDSTPELESKDQNTGNEADIAGSSGEQLISPIPEDVDQDLPNSAESLGYNPLLMQFNKNDLPLGRNSDEDGSLTKEVLEFVEYLKQLSISPLQFKAFPGLLLAPDNRISIQIKVDDDEVLETIAVTGSHSSRIYSETAVVELSKQNQHIKLVFIEHLPNSETRQIGRLTIKKRDIIPINGTEVV